MLSWGFCLSGKTDKKTKDMVSKLYCMLDGGNAVERSSRDGEGQQESERLKGGMLQLYTGWMYSDGMHCEKSQCSEMFF